MPQSALLVMDVQTGIVERFADGSAGLLATLNRAIDAARTSDVPVIFVRVAFRAGTPEISPLNETFRAAAGRGGLGLEDPSTQIHPDLARRPEDLVVIKKRVSAFAGSDLEVIVRSLGVDSLVLSGIATSGVVLSTLRQAADLDFRLTVLRDGCADADPEVHRVLLDRVFPRQAAVMATGEWVTGLGGSPAG